MADQNIKFQKNESPNPENEQKRRFIEKIKAYFAIKLATDYNFKAPEDSQCSEMSGEDFVIIKKLGTQQSLDIDKLIELCFKKTIWIK